MYNQSPQIKRPAEPSLEGASTTKRTKVSSCVARNDFDVETTVVPAARRNGTCIDDVPTDVLRWLIYPLLNQVDVAHLSSVTYKHNQGLHAIREYHRAVETEELEYQQECDERRINESALDIVYGP
jgi:hypothetical protein